MTGLTPKQARCLSAIKTRLSAGYSPSYAELQADLGYKTRSAIYRLVEKLYARGEITRDYHLARSIELTAKPFELPTQSQLEQLSDEEVRRLYNVFCQENTRRVIAICGLHTSHGPNVTGANAEGVRS